MRLQEPADVPSRCVLLSPAGAHKAHGDRCWLLRGQSPAPLHPAASQARFRLLTWLLMKCSPRGWDVALQHVTAQSAYIFIVVWNLVMRWERRRGGGLPLVLWLHFMLNRYRILLVSVFVFGQLYIILQSE